MLAKGFGDNINKLMLNNKSISELIFNGSQIWTSAKDVIPNPDPIPDATNLLDAGFPLGLLTKYNSLEKPNQVKTLKKCQGFTLENSFKSTIKSYDPITGKYTTSFVNIDPQLRWAKANNKKVHAHTGLWSMNVADWIYNKKNPTDPNTLAGNPNMTPQKWKDLLKIMIQEPLLHCKNDPSIDGVVDSYDVINEPWNEALTINETKQTWKHCIFVEKIGETYEQVYKQCLRWAREADSRIKLFINDYGFHSGWLKVDRMVTFMNQCKAEGVPLDGWGFQLHTKVSTNINNVRTNLVRLAEGVDYIHFSEVALSLRNAPFFVQGEPFPYTQEMAIAQAINYRDVVGCFLQDIPKSKQYRFTTWGTNDASYMGNDLVRYAMLFNDAFEEKLAYQYILDLVNTLNKN